MIFYLSCTGNTRWAAEYLARRTSDKVMSITDVAPDFSYTLSTEERLGFCFPVHGWRPSILFRNFISHLHISGYRDNYTYALCTAGDNIGETMDIFKSDISHLGITLNAECSLVMPESYLGFPFFNLDSNDNERRKIKNASVKLKVFADVVKEYRQGYSELDYGRWPKINSRLLGGVFTNKLLTDKPFVVDSSKCIHCGKCASVCPTDNIKYDSSELPQWEHSGKCISCFSCYHHCPSRAIDYGSLTKGKGQYYFKSTSIK